MLDCLASIGLACLTVIPKDPPLCFLGTEVTAAYCCGQLVRCVLGLELRISHLRDNRFSCHSRQFSQAGSLKRPSLGSVSSQLDPMAVLKQWPLMSSPLKGGIFVPTLRVQVDWQLHWLAEKQKQGWNVKGRSLRSPGLSFKKRKCPEAATTGQSASYSDRRVRRPSGTSLPVYTQLTGQEASTVPTYQVLFVAD